MNSSSLTNSGTFTTRGLNASLYHSGNSSTETFSNSGTFSFDSSSSVSIQIPSSFSGNMQISQDSTLILQSETSFADGSISNIAGEIILADGSVSCILLTN